MSSPVIGQDCHITLTHADVNSGSPYGFLVDDDEKGTRPGGVQITHEVDSAGTTRLWLYFDVLLSDNSINPDGSIHSPTRTADYAALLQYLGKMDGIILDTPIGSFLNLGAVGWTADERHLPKSSIVKCQVNNIGVYWPPVDSAALELSIWDGTLTWGTSYWR
jgi:hypothetical protein